MDYSKNDVIYNKYVSGEVDANNLSNEDIFLLYEILYEKNDANALYEFKHRFYKTEFDDICCKIRKVDGNRAVVIANAKLEGWWDQDIIKTRKEILKSPGDVAMAIFYTRDIWGDNVCDIIRRAGGNRAFAIACMAVNNAWDNCHKHTICEILNSPGNKYLALTTIGGYYCEHTLY